MDIKGDGKNSLDLKNFFENFKIEFAALKKNTEEKDLCISSLETRLKKLEKSYQEDVRDLKNDIVDIKERVLDTEQDNCKNTIILNNPSKLKGKLCVEVIVDFLSQFLYANTLPADLKAFIFRARLTSLLILWNFFILGREKLFGETKRC